MGPTEEGTEPPIVQLDDITGAQGQGQGVGEQRRDFLISKSLEEARRSLELRLWSDAAVCFLNLSQFTCKDIVKKTIATSP